MEDEVDRAFKLCGSFSAELREVGKRELEKLYLAGSNAAGLELASYLLGEGFECELGKPEAVKILATEVRLTGNGGAFLDLYYHGGDLVSDELLGELLPLAAPNGGEASEIWEAKLPGWRHPLA